MKTTVIHLTHRTSQLSNTVHCHQMSVSLCDQRDWWETKGAATPHAIRGLLHIPHHGQGKTPASHGYHFHNIVKYKTLGGITVTQRPFDFLVVTDRPRLSSSCTWVCVQRYLGKSVESRRNKRWVYYVAKKKKRLKSLYASCLQKVHRKCIRTQWCIGYTICLTK